MDKSRIKLPQTSGQIVWLDVLLLKQNFKIVVYGLYEY